MCRECERHQMRQNSIELLAKLGSKLNTRHADDCLASQFLGSWSGCLLAADAIQQVGAHLAPRNRLASFGDHGKTALRSFVERVAALCGLNAALDHLWNKGVGRFDSCAG